MRYGFLGLGNMASAILRGMVKSGNFSEDEFSGFNRTEAKTLALQKELGLRPAGSAAELARSCDVLALCVKPQMLPAVLPETAQNLRPGTLVVTIAAGKPLSYYEAALPQGTPVVRVMPNINARVLAAASGLCGGASARPEQLALVRRMFEAVGAVYELPEAQFSAFSALAGASGAFIHLYIDALASAGVKAGLPRALSQQIACQTVLGSAKLTLESGEHPIALCDQVCSPGGTTIEGVHTLKRLGFESAVQQAVDAVIEKDRKLAE